MKILMIAFASLFFMNCQDHNAQEKMSKELSNATPVKVETTQKGYEKAYFASGCFWCVEAIYESVKGVKESVSGYAGGHTKNPTYEESNTGRTGHAEAVEIIYNPKEVSFKTLVDVYYGSQNVTQKNGQGPDIGLQYRSIIFYQNEEQKSIIKNKVKELQKDYHEPIAAEVMPFQKFWEAEAYHQDYKKNHPNNSYVKNVSNPRFYKFKKKFPELLKEGC